MEDKCCICNKTFEEVGHLKSSSLINESKKYCAGTFKNNYSGCYEKIFDEKERYPYYKQPLPPKYIKCPFCNNEIEIDFDKIDKCPKCQVNIILGEYDEGFTFIKIKNNINRIEE